MVKNQIELQNELVKSYPFLKEMYEDDYYPNFLIDKGKNILIHLCFQIEKKHPKNLSELYKLTHLATDKFNQLQEEFEENDSEIETVAREIISKNFDFIANSYGFKNANEEELIATRDW